MLAGQKPKPELRRRKKKQSTKQEQERREGTSDSVSSEPATYSRLFFRLTTALAFLTRFWYLNHPEGVVFDEIYFGQSLGAYIRGEFYFDVHPPLGKMLLGLAGYLSGYDGMFPFKSIGDSFEGAVPHVCLRSWPAFCGSMIIPVSYLTMSEMGISTFGCVFGSLLLILGMWRILNHRSWSDYNFADFGVG